MVIRALSSFVMRLFFSAVRTFDAERIPSEGAVLIVANHHSALVDPVALLATMPRPPRFLAKAALWSPKYLVLRPFLALAHAIPVHRQADGGGDNTKMFAASHRALGDGHVIALFGEGFSHDLPGLMDLKTGAARIAFGTPGQVTVVPVGLIYDDRATFRSRAMLYVGEPMVVTGSSGGDEDRDAVRTLTQQIAAGLAQVAPSWESWEMHDDARIAARLLAGDDAAVELGDALSAINAEVDSGSALGREIQTGVHALEAEADRLGLEIETVVDQPRAKVGRLQTMSTIETLFWAVPALVGRALNWPPFALIGILVRRQDLNFTATAKIILGLVLYPIWWVLLAVTAWWLRGPLLGVVVMLVVPALGYVSALKMPRLRRMANSVDLEFSTSETEANRLELARSSVLASTRAALARSVQK